jgi:hypothetical protein
MVEKINNTGQAKVEIGEISQEFKQLHDTWEEELPDNHSGLSTYVRLLSSGECFNRDFLTYAHSLDLYNPELEVEADEEEIELLNSGKLDFLLSTDDDKEHPSEEEVIEFLRSSWAKVFQNVLLVLREPEKLSAEEFDMYQCVIQPDPWVNIKINRLNGLKGVINYLSRNEEGFDINKSRKLTREYFEVVKVQKVRDEDPKDYIKRVESLIEKYAMLGFRHPDWEYHDIEDN